VGFWSAMRAPLRRPSDSEAADEAPALRPVPAFDPPYLAVDDLPDAAWLAEDDPAMAEVISMLAQGQRFTQVTTALSASLRAHAAQVLACTAADNGWTVEWLRPNQRWRSADDVHAALDGLPRGAQGKRLILVPDLHTAFVRAPGTAAAASAWLGFLLALREVSDESVAVWMGCRPHAWQRLVRWRQADAVVDAVEPLAEPDSAALAARLLSLHARSGRGLGVMARLADAASAPVQADQLQPLTDWVEAVRARSGGDLGVLARLARDHAGLNADGDIVLRPVPAPSLPALAGLSYPLRYQLIEVLVHGEMTVDELAELFVCPPERMAADLTALHGWQLLESVNGRIGLPATHATWIARRLSALQSLE
jgi:hypothetical protein